MALKMKIAAALAALTVTSAASVVAYAESGPFTLTAKVGETSITPKADALKKQDLLYAYAIPEEGVPAGFYVTFQVKEYDGSNATKVNYATENNVSCRMEYLAGHGELGKTYRLSATLDSNPVVKSATVSGRWAP